MRSKHRWYKCLERIQYPKKPAAEINHLYDWMHRDELVLRSCPEQWYKGYEDVGIKFDLKGDTGAYWWDWEVMRMFEKYGTGHFAELGIWDCDWEELRRLGIQRGINGLPTRGLNSPLG